FTVESAAAVFRRRRRRTGGFGTAPGIDVVDSSKSSEELKRKARAERFSQPDSNSKANGKGDIEVKTAIADKAGGGT
ncbi:hypothetical protein MIMGU_mgv11b023465mg, partial [Erythranthe guttata]